MPKPTQYKASKLLNDVVNKASFYVKDQHGKQFHVVEVSRLPFFEEKIREHERGKTIKPQK